MKIEQLLNNECHVLDQLLSTLQQEAQALLDRDTKVMDESAQRKRSLLIAFQKQAKKRQAYLSSQGVNTDETGLLSLVEQVDTETRTHLKQLWSRTRELFSNVIRKNEENGIVIQHSQQRTRNLLKILHGDRNRPNLYNEKGSAGKGAQSHRLGEA
ncbi:flagella synthesis protein FlgN [Bermanella sp. R86510]|uniref:flagella synthesis protein FlgN n=1 Tax=unclassified Bermanella TaxID=2627862 RepID=UPI0037C64F0C